MTCIAGDLRWNKVDKSGGVIGSENFFGVIRCSYSNSESPETKSWLISLKIVLKVLCLEMIFLRGLCNEVTDEKIGFELQIFYNFQFFAGF